MNTSTKLGAYLLGVAVLFGGAIGAGRAVGPTGPPLPAAGGHGTHTTPAASAPAPTSPPGLATTGLPAPGGLQVSQDGYTLTPRSTTLRPGEATDLRFTVTGPDGRPVTGYQVQHDRRLHFMVVSRDLSGFQHLHPEEAGDGEWSVRLTVPEAGAYRAFADFTPLGAGGMTLGTDLYAAGDYTPRALPSASRTATVDGYTVTLDGDLVPGRSSKLTLTVSRDGRPVTDLQPYLGAYGHLVALRAGDLAYLHVHPEGGPGDGRTAPGPGVTFQVEVPSRGDYRLYLDFQHAGTVRTADLTVSAGQHKPPAPTSPETPAHGAGQHDEHTH